VSAFYTICGLIRQTSVVVGKSFSSSWIYRNWSNAW